MAHFAQINNLNIVLEVIVVNNATIDNLSFPESEPVGVAFCKSIYGADTLWKQTSYNGTFRKNYAGIDYTYNEQLDAFIPPQPAPECVLDAQNCRWVCPPPAFENVSVDQSNVPSLAALPPEEAP